MKSTYNRIISRVTDFVSDQHRYFAAAMLIVMFLLGITSMVGNSAIVDEVAHIPAAYSYLKLGDYRLNPEHPPLIKDIAAIPLQFMNLKFPTNSNEWLNEVNGEWDTGWDFLYNLGNNADAILFWARLPILLMTVGFGAFLYWYTRRRWGTWTALLALFFYSFSPNFIGNGILVTTDVGASVFMFIGLVTFVRFADDPSESNVLLLSLALAGAQLAKFSGPLLYPFCLIVTFFIAGLSKKGGNWRDRLGLWSGGFILASVISVVWIYLFYIPPTFNMPTAVQDRLIAGSLIAPNMITISHVLVSVSQWHLGSWAFMKPLVQFALGLAMVAGRVVGGNVTYFNGQVSIESFKLYFPEIFALKTQVAFLILMLTGAGVMSWRFFRRRPVRGWTRFRRHFMTHIPEWTLGGFAVFYFAVSIAGNLNLGVRHILPVYIPLFMVVAIFTVKFTRELAATKWKQLAAGVLVLLLAWYGGSTLWIHPSYLAYFNELIGGPANAENYFSDSGIDWGQDLKRLKTYVDANPQIKHIAIDYFGGGLPQYYFCQREYNQDGSLNTTDYDCSHSKMEIWHSSYGQYPGQYIAVSETYLENDRYYSALAGQPGYAYLRAKTPIAKIGYSIYVYKLY
jgi:Dolichyl-phosphate-mannose-protein mannosyltransferase